MPARKAASKSSKKSASKTSAKSSKAASYKETKPGIIRPLYGIAITEATARGDATEMRQMATYARKHLKDVQAALAKLEQRIAKSSAK